MQTFLFFLFLECIFYRTFALFTVDAPTSTYSAQYGGTVQMACTFQVEDNFNINDLRVSWEHIPISDTQNKEVILFTNGRTDLSKQDSSYYGRTSLLMDELTKGRAILEISDVKLTDAGKYICILQLRGSDYKTIDLGVQASYKNIHTYTQKSANGEDVSLACQALGFPKAEVYWKNNGINISVQTNTSYILTDEGLYNTTSTIPIKLNSRQSYDCVFVNRELNEITVGSIDCSGQENAGSVKLIHICIVTLLVLFGAILIMILVKRKSLFKCFRKKGNRRGPL
ncbi:programmed cell death 1 ligand 2-like [Discoglossus pictus]